MNDFAAPTFIEEYRKRAHAPEMHHMAGRPQYLTEFLSKRIAEKMKFGSSDVVVDVGCGYGHLLYSCHKQFRSGIGTCATQDEVDRLRLVYASIPNLIFLQGLAHALPLPDNYASRVVCTWVLVILDEKRKLATALRELARIAKPDALVWVGGMMDGTMPSRPTFLQRIIDSTRRNRLKTPLKALHATARVLNAPQQLKIITSPPNELIALAESFGLTPIWHGAYLDTDQRERSATSPHVWDYLFQKDTRRAG